MKFPRDSDSKNKRLYEVYKNAYSMNSSLDAIIYFYNRARIVRQQCPRLCALRKFTTRSTMLRVICSH